MSPRWVTKRLPENQEARSNLPIDPTRGEIARNMKKQDRIPVIRKKQEENEILEEETRKMEQRLRMLKNALYKNAAQDSGKSATALWQSSCASTPQENLNRFDGKLDFTRLKLKTLKKDSSGNVEKKVDNAYSELLKKVMDDFKANKTEVRENPVITCGQCENKAAAVSCQECSEDYCAKCFARFHLKGALRRHHSLPLSAPRNNSRSATNDNNERNHDDMDSITESTETESIQVRNQGCQGIRRATEKNNFTVQTETEDAGDCRPTSRFVQLESKGTSVEKTIDPPTLQIEFSPSLSYAERLLVHRNRQEPVIKEAAITKATGDHPVQPPTDSNEDEDIQNDLSTNRPTFEQLHRLATQNITASDLYAMCQLEDIERSSGYASTSPRSPHIRLTECVSGLGSNDDDDPNPSSARALYAVRSPRTQTPASPTKSLMESEGALVEPEHKERSASQNIQGNRVTWHPDETCRGNQSNPNELTTIELIKNQLNRMTTDIPRTTEL